MATQLHGIGVGRGVAVAPVRRMPEPVLHPVDAVSALTPEEERARASAAVAATAGELRERAARAVGAARDVLAAQALMAADPTLRAGIDERLGAGATAEAAVAEAAAGFRSRLEGLGGAWGERAGDLADVARRVIARLTGAASPGIPTGDAPFVLVARDLAPADAALLDPAVVAALVLEAGGPTSHTAIIAREKGVPAVVGVIGARQLADGVLVAVDAVEGSVLVDPAPAEIARVRDAAAARARAAVEGPGRLADGTAVPLLANLGAASEAAAAVAAGAEGVGLLRTERAVLDAAEAPGVEAQRAEYARVLAAFPGRTVTVRVFDAGADKPLAFLSDRDEPNPALGLRGLRALLRHEDVLRDQLRALAEAASGTGAHLQVMAPMVTTAAEAAAFCALAHEAGVPEAGVVIEVPAAALLADRILAVADFVSIGTNDLAQYTMAADRQLGTVAGYQDPWHPAVLQLVARIAEAGAAAGKAVTVCGEAAADPLLAVVLVGLGVTGLSMPPTALAPVRDELAAWTRDRARSAAAAAREAVDGASARSAVREMAEYSGMV